MLGQGMINENIVRFCLKIKGRKKMQKTKSLIAMILLIVLAVSIPIQVSMLAPVQAANLNVPVYLKVYAEPNPVGVGQTVFISMFFTKPIPNAAGQFYTGLTLNIVKPDGTNQTLGPYTGDTTGGVGGITFVPSELGNYTVQAFYPGQNITTGEHLIATLSSPDHVYCATRPNPRSKPRSITNRILVQTNLCNKLPVVTARRQLVGPIRTIIH